MRSRYSAFVLLLDRYLLETWHSETRPESLDFEPIKWLGLKVVRAEHISDTEACVEFVARGRVSGRGFRHHELSRFIFENDRWYYVDGKMFEK